MQEIILAIRNILIKLGVVPWQMKMFLGHVSEAREYHLIF